MSRPFDRREFVARNQFLMPWSSSRTVTTARAAELLNVGSTTIRDMVERGELEGYKLRKLSNSPYRVSLDSIERHMRRIRETFGLDEEK